MLRNVADDEPGIRRVRRGRAFSYKRPDGRLVRGRERERIESLAIPPAWRDVWVCRDGNGHIQATGLDEAGRKQYLYHPRWRMRRDADKFDGLAELAQRLPRLRRDVEADLAREGLGRERIVAAVVRAIEATFCRIGSERYTKNGSFGLASLRCRHAEVKGSRVLFRFPAKGGKVLEVDLHDAAVARVVRALAAARGDRLFRYRDEAGHWRLVRARDVNDYVKAALGDGFSAKDLRTWGATVLYATLLADAGARRTRKERQQVVREAVTAVAERLGNTPAVCRRSYLHPGVTAAYVDGRLDGTTRNRPSGKGLWPEEVATLAALQAQAGARAA